nr:MAG TPA: hypothetical protein [Caudoviricetes sp.]
MKCKKRRCFRWKLQVRLCIGFIFKMIIKKI